MIRAVRSNSPDVEIRAWARRPEIVERLRDEEGLGSGATNSLREAIAGADCIVLAMPTGAMAAVVGQFDGFPADSDVLVTDVGSVKSSVEADVGNLVRSLGARFIGSHPMAGSEKAGLVHADEHLFEDAPVILTPQGDDEDSRALGQLSDFWIALGARVSTMSPAEHDTLVASISHLPHLVAAALVKMVMGSNEQAGKFCGGGFRDTTRVSAGLEEMWSGILVDNQEAVSDQLGAFIAELGKWKEVIDSLDRDQLRRFLSQARTLRESL